MKDKIAACIILNRFLDLYNDNENKEVDENDKCLDNNI